MTASALVERAERMRQRLEVEAPTPMAPQTRCGCGALAELEPDGRVFCDACSAVTDLSHRPPALLPDLPDPWAERKDLA